MFLTEKFVQIVDEVISVKEEKDEGNTKKNTIWTNFSAKNTTIQSSFRLSFLVIGKECFTIEFECDVGILVIQALALTCIAQGMRLLCSFSDNKGPLSRYTYLIYA